MGFEQYLTWVLRPYPRYIDCGPPGLEAYMAPMFGDIYLPSSPFPSPPLSPLPSLPFPSSSPYMHSQQLAQ